MQGEKTETANTKKIAKKNKSVNANHLLGFEIDPETAPSAPSMFKDKHRGYTFPLNI